MKYFAESMFLYLKRQIKRQGSEGKLLVMTPSLPAPITTRLGDRISAYALEQDLPKPVIGVLKEVVEEWLLSTAPSERLHAANLQSKEWVSESLTALRDVFPEQQNGTVMLLIGIDRASDSGSLADFHHVDLDTVWHQELECSFAGWVRDLLGAGIGYEEATVERFDSILKPIVEFGLADVLQISSLLEEMNLSTAQDGRDTEKILLASLASFGLPRFENYSFRSPMGFGNYLRDAVEFFNYDAFLDARNRNKALKTLTKFEVEFADNLDANAKFEPTERGPFTSDKAFLEAIRVYISEGEPNSKMNLLLCDFITVRDRVLGYTDRKPKTTTPAVKKLSGGPIEVFLTAIWITLADFKRKALREHVFAHETLQSISIRGTLFKHDCDGASAEERRANAITYLGKLLGGTDRTLQTTLDTTHLRSDGGDTSFNSVILNESLDYRFARTAEPALEFEIKIEGVGFNEDIRRNFAWRLPETHPYRVAQDLIRWAVNNLRALDESCFPVYNLDYYGELLLAKDDEETSRILLQSIQSEGGCVKNLFTAPDFDSTDSLFPFLRTLALVHADFLNHALEKGLHDALLESTGEVCRAYENACRGYLTKPECAESPLATMLFRAFLIIPERETSASNGWMWDPYEASCIVTILHPAVLEMLHSQNTFLIQAFTIVAAKEIKSPGSRSFRDTLWRSYVELASIQTPLSGLLKDSNKILETQTKGTGLVHRIGTGNHSPDTLTTRMLLRYDGSDEEDTSDSELFRSSRESSLLFRIFRDFKDIHPHVEDGFNLAVYQNHDIQPVIAAVDEFLINTVRDRIEGSKLYSVSVTFFTESTDESGVTRWVNQWKERLEAAESQVSLSHYRKIHLSIAHRIVSAENQYGQFSEIIKKGLDADVAILNGFIRAGSQGNDFQAVDPYNVLNRTLKFPILEKAFCAFRDPGKRLHRARVLSNHQFRVSTYHTEIMARLKNPATPSESQHVVLGYGDFEPWQDVINSLHKHAEWVVCIDANIDEALISYNSRDKEKPREIIGFGSGVGSHGEANFTISTEQFRLSDVELKLKSSIANIYSGWSKENHNTIARSVLRESQRLSGLSLVRATGVGDYVRDFMAYSLTRKILQSTSDWLCDQLVSLDAYQHWFDFAESEVRPDLVWVRAKILDSGRIKLDLRLIECKLAKTLDAHLDKAHHQLESGLRHLVLSFLPRTTKFSRDDNSPDRRYWWLQLHRLVASKAEIGRHEQKKVLSALERLSEGDYDIDWYATAIAFWTDQDKPKLTCEDTWRFELEGRIIDIGVASAGKEFVRTLCHGTDSPAFPWAENYAVFESARSMDFETDERISDNENEALVQTLSSSSVQAISTEKSEDEKIVVEKIVVEKKTNIPKRIMLGSTSQGTRKVYWEFGHPGLNNRHMLIFGTSGMGKTYTVQCLLFEMGRARQNSLILDYTSGFQKSQIEAQLNAHIKPHQHLIRKLPLAINPFRRQNDHFDEETIPEPISNTAQRVSGVFSSVYSFGDQQKAAIYQAVKAGLENGDMTLPDLLPQLEVLTEQKGQVGQSASSVISKIQPFIDQNPFGKETPESWERFFSDPENRCHIIQLAGVMKDAARLVTEFSLIDLYWFYRIRGTQDSPRVIVLDEVQNLDHREESPLAQLLREGRKFGFSLILATQNMSNLGKDERDRLFNAGHKLFFRPADTEMKSYAEIASMVGGDKVNDWITRLSSLKKGECYSLGPSLNEVTGKLETKVFKIQITSLNERGFDAQV